MGRKLKILRQSLKLLELIEDLSISPWRMAGKRRGSCRREGRSHGYCWSWGETSEREARASCIRIRGGCAPRMRTGQLPRRFPVMFPTAGAGGIREGNREVVEVGTGERFDAQAAGRTAGKILRVREAPDTLGRIPDPHGVQVCSFVFPKPSGQIEGRLLTRRQEPGLRSNIPVDDRNPGSIRLRGEGERC